MKAAIWVLDSFRALPRYLLVLAAVSALALLARAAVPSFSPIRQATPGPRVAAPASDARSAALAVPSAAHGQKLLEHGGSGVSTSTSVR
ncbi:MULTISPECIES: hypothetical protein [unclassified Lysobacter]|uniref:hypothetical protein n=1 Tax=unclassified Lysobacter TaxID=2635362 RepID=UPI001BE8B2CC|nr:MULTISPECIES: hypothetical protein [unclassified Lysobacter]MBT2749107.1 hypothetical protein [Lysobacter sp. ISL-42]MBT2751421.1 hypothetical protein [Lysobacter sp. ISL-50]MBT2781561.1 hypothetical protein [Lysobacter sp. ISL-52]